ncbi:MAG: MBL fold metallo-hydrolase [Candidatus Paceibacterota bacterium]|jgi:competence protein ComEC
MKNFKKYLPYIFISALVISAVVIGYFIYARDFTHKYLKVIFLDVGQGDAIYIEAPGGKQMLIDGGKGVEILPKLIKVMPIFDKSIDVVVVSNPDEDHIGGLVEVLKNYKVGLVLEPGTKSDTLVYENLKKEISENKIPDKITRRGTRIILDDKKNIYFDILFPDRDVINWERNDGSIVGRLVYGESSFMLMGDATKYTENLIGWNENIANLKSDVLKLGHHGSRTSSSILWLERVDPDVAIISAGENNRYGHPHKEILDNLNLLDIPYLATYEKGNIIFKTDGTKLVH